MEGADFVTSHKAGREEGKPREEGNECCEWNM